MMKDLNHFGINFEKLNLLIITRYVILSLINLLGNDSIFNVYGVLCII